MSVQLVELVAVYPGLTLILVAAAAYALRSVIVQLTLAVLVALIFLGVISLLG